MTLDCGDRLQAIAGLGYDLGGSELTQLITELFARQLLVVNDYDAH